MIVGLCSVVCWIEFEVVWIIVELFGDDDLVFCVYVDFFVVFVFDVLLFECFCFFCKCFVFFVEMFVDFVMWCFFYVFCGVLVDCFVGISIVMIFVLVFGFCCLIEWIELVELYFWFWFVWFYDCLI